MSSGNQRYINTAGSHNITMGDDFINVSTSVGEITLIFPNIRDSGAINLNKVWFVNDVDDMAEKNNVIIVASETTPATELNGNESVVLNTNGFSAEVVPSGYYSYMVNSGVVNSPDSPIPKIYKALLTQVETNPPVATGLVNTFSNTPSYQYNSNGEFQLNLAGEFPDITKVFLLIGTLGSAGSAQFAYNDTNSIIINTFNVLGELTDNLLYSTSISIEVYP